MDILLGLSPTYQECPPNGVKPTTGEKTPLPPALRANILASEEALREEAL